MTQPAMKLETTQANNVPLRQFSLYRPPYEELYTFWWKCMQITLHDKGTQTITAFDKVGLSTEDSPMTGTDPNTDTKGSENDQLKQLMAMVSYYNSVGRENRSKSTKTFRGASALAPAGFSASMLPSAAVIPETTSSTSTRPASTGVDVTTPVMEQRPLFPSSSSPIAALVTSSVNTPSFPSSSTSSSQTLPSFSSTQTLTVGGSRMEPLISLGGLSTPSSPPCLLPQSFSPPTLKPASSPPTPSLLTTPLRSGPSPLPSLIKASPGGVSLLGNPLLTTAPSLSSATSTTSPLAQANLCTSVLSPSRDLKQDQEKRDMLNLNNSKIFGVESSSTPSLSLSAALLSQPLFSQAMSHLTQSLTSSPAAASLVNMTSSQGIDSPTNSPTPSDNNHQQQQQSPCKQDSLIGSPSVQVPMKDSPTSASSPNESSCLSFTDTTDQLSDLIHIKQLTDVLGRKAVLDSLSPTISGGSDLSQYLGSTISMAQAASLLGQLDTSSTSRSSLLGSLCTMPLYNMKTELKSDGYTSTLDSEVEVERSRHYQAAEQDTSNITLPEGFESEDHLTWSEVESFVNEFKTKRVKLGYTQAHVGAALALVHGPEFSQTTISRFEGLQLSFPNHKKIIPILRRWLESVENPTKRRHSSPNGLHGNNQNGNSKRRKRTTISSNSKEILEQYYQTNPLPSTEEIGNLSNNLALDKRVIRIWFQNRRAIGKRLSKLIVTMGGGATRSHSNQTTPIATMQQQGMFKYETTISGGLD